MNKHSRLIGSHIYIVDEIDSTNSELLKNADNYEHGSVLCARKQTAGKGRHQRDWRSHKGGLYFSILLKDQSNISSIYPFVLLSALAVVRSIRTCATQGIAIKWPNDIYIQHRKVCGILAESETQGKLTNIVIGIGINVNNSVSHLKNLRHPAVSLKECLGEEININNLLNRIVDELDTMYSDLISDRFVEYLPELNRLLYSKEQEIELASGNAVRKIIPLSFTRDAKLLCEENGAKHEIFLGEM